MTQFNKTTGKPSDLLKKVKARGLLGLDDDAGTKLFYDSMQKVGYYRLTGYFLHFQQLNSAVDARRHYFYPNTTFKHILDMYEFDTRLRDLALSALEKIEVALRTSICEFMCQKEGAHWYLKQSSFTGGKLTLIHEEACKHLDYDVKNNRPFSQTPIPNTKAGHLFIQHYYSRYTNPITPPGWMLREVASFGFWARTFDALDPAYKKSISDNWKYPDGKRIHYSILSDWLWSLSILRNRCAHHARITTRSFPFPPPVPADNDAKNCFEQKTDDLRTLFVVISLLLRNVVQNDVWKSDLILLLEAYPNIDMKKAAGFSRGEDQRWKDIQLFQLL
ncbi:Abi family protein [Herbaspirillum lusitanum]|uniref:Abi family protein n=1 Tax=Herbaspirillum lusitanum TaxID=213312 RepID=UPI00037084F6|nr:Abi family protein [Herbaspirillum lusitanum]